MGLEASQQGKGYGANTVPDSAEGPEPKYARQAKMQKSIHKDSNTEV